MTVEKIHIITIENLPFGKLPLIQFSNSHFAILFRKAKLLSTVQRDVIITSYTSTFKIPLRKC